LLDLYETLFDRSYLNRAVQLTDIMLREFWDERDGGFFFTGISHEPLISRAKPVFDASIPSGNAIATQLLLRLYHFTGENRYRASADRVLRSYYAAMASQPFGFAHLLCALDAYVQGTKEIVIIGEPTDAAVKNLLAEVNSIYLPNKVLQIAAAGLPAEISPLLGGKTQIDGRATAYVCQNFTCSAPVTNPTELRELLESSTV
jgi:hypothetical protein